MSTLTPLDDDAWPKAAASLFGTFATDLNVYRVMARHPDLLNSWVPLREHIVRRSALGPDRAEVVVLRCGVEWNSTYEVAQHVPRARDMGFTKDRIAALLGDRRALRGEDRILADAVAELIKGGRLASSSLEQLVPMLKDEGVLDLFATVGMYATLAFVTNSLQTPLESGSR